WAHETMTKTLLNRRVAQTVGWHFGLQLLLGTGAWLAGLSPMESQTLHVLLWASTPTMLAIWAERWFGVSGGCAAGALLVSCARPPWLFGAMSATNLVFTLLLVLVWFPKQDVEILRTSGEFRRRARRMFLDMSRRAPGREEPEEVP